MSRFRPLHAALLLIAAAAIAGPLWLISPKPERHIQTVATPAPPPEPPYIPPKPVTRAKFTRFERMAVKACHCARGRSEKAVDACWAGFEKATQPYSPSTEDYTCMSDETGLCFAIKGEPDEHCIMIDRNGAGACSEREVVEQGARCQP